LIEGGADVFHGLIDIEATAIAMLVKSDDAAILNSKTSIDRTLSDLSVIECLKGSADGGFIEDREGDTPSMQALTSGEDEITVWGGAEWTERGVLDFTPIGRLNREGSLTSEPLGEGFFGKSDG
jgi:hypothetical protein